MSSSLSSGLLRMRRTVGVLVVATVAAVLAPLPASAETVTTPTITAPSEGATIVSSPMLVSADSGAAYVRFVVAGQVKQTVPVSTGSAVTEIPVHGLDGNTWIDAYDCDTETSCADTPVSITVNVDLKAPGIIAPSRNDVVGSSVTVTVKTIWGGALRFFVDGSPVGIVLGSSTRLAKKVSLKDRKDGDHVLSVKQCNSDGSICDGGTDAVTVLKDTKGPKFTDVDSSLGTVYPARDNFKDTAKLSARVAEKSFGNKVEIRKAGGPLVRTLKLGRENAGRLSVSWNGRKSNGAMVPKGKYLFRFVGTDVNGVVGKSDDKVIHVSDKKLVKKSATKIVSAKGSFVGDGSGRCSGVYSLVYQGSKYGWRSGAGYYSRASCNGTQADDLALGFHRAGVNGAIRYGSLRIDTYGGGAARRSGPGVMVTYKSNLKAGASRQLSAGLGWHAGPSVNMSNYVKGGKVRWGLATVSGNWYDVKEYRITYTYFVLR